jgi:hypothetical protein
MSQARKRMFAPSRRFAHGVRRVLEFEVPVTASFVVA